VVGSNNRVVCFLIDSQQQQQQQQQQNNTTMASTIATSSSTMSSGGSNLYYIRNDTGTIAWYKLSNHREAHRLLPGIEQPLVLHAPGMNNIKQSASSLSNLSSKANNSNLYANSDSAIWSMRQRDTQQTMAVLVEGNYKTHSGLRINTNGVSRLHLDARTNIASFDVGYRQGSKVVVIRSRVLIVNHTPELLDVQFGVQVEGGAHRQIEVKHGVAPGSSVAVPLAYALNGLISFRPTSTSHKYQNNPLKLTELHAAILERQRSNASLAMLPSTMVSSAAISQDFVVARYLVVCPPQTAQYGQFFVMVKVETTHDGQDIEIMLHPPIVIQNLLPLTCALTIYDHQIRKPCYQTQISRGQVCYVSV
jgi:hypothetical protein